VGGLIFLNTGANIPDGRLTAANWVFQFSLLSLFVSLISSPFNSVIVAHERMTVYAYTSIVESVLRLAICFIVIAFPGDKLIFYSFMQVLVGVGMQAFYSIYCGSNFYEAHYSVKLFDRSIFKELAKYSGWNLMDKATWVFNIQGVNMLINVLFGVTYNAARGVALTINGCIQKFVGSFMVAFTPQIIKSYADNDYNYSFSLTNRGTKFSWYLILIFIVPVFIEAETLLNMWLVEVPLMAVLFLRFALFESLATRSGEVLNVLIHATGDIKAFTIKASLFGFLVFPISWILFRLGAPAWSTYAVYIVIYFLMNFIRLSSLKTLVNFDVFNTLRTVFLPCVVVTLIAFSLPVALSCFFAPSVIRFFWMVPLAVAWTMLVIYFVGLTHNEKIFVSGKAKQLMRKFIR
jgi:O-antigen/teichoic acid export membrane protein